MARVHRDPKLTFGVKLHCALDSAPLTEFECVQKHSLWRPFWQQERCVLAISFTEPLAGLMSCDLVVPKWQATISNTIRTYLVSLLVFRPRQGEGDSLYVFDRIHSYVTFHLSRTIRARLCYTVVSSMWSAQFEIPNFPLWDFAEFNRSIGRIYELRFFFEGNNVLSMGM